MSEKECAGHRAATSLSANEADVQRTLTVVVNDMLLERSPAEQSGHLVALIAKG